MENSRVTHKKKDFSKKSDCMGMEKVTLHPLGEMPVQLVKRQSSGKTQDGTAIHTITPGVGGVLGGRWSPRPRLEKGQRARQF